MNTKHILVALFLSLSLAACNQDDEVKIETPASVLAGGETTIFSSGPDAYTFPLANLNQADIEKHFIADGAFAQQFVSAPATAFGGVGPLFNQNSCESCHTRNGRGAIPQFEGDPNSGLLLRLSMGNDLSTGIIPVPGFGGQLQNKAIFGVTPEGKVSKTEVEQIIAYADGLQVSLKKPTYTIADPYTSVPAGIMISPRAAPAVYGLGLIDAIPTADILALADESDANNDGISGKANRVWDVKAQQLRLGKYGWKAEQPTAKQQAADAAHNDMGLTSSFFPNNPCDGQSNCEEGLQETYDLDDETTDLFSFYFETVAVPAQRNATDPEVKLGGQLFVDANCNSCHVEKYVTGPHQISALENQTIFPYTDLLLHDMGEGLADNRPSYLATGQEWRTPPLWGIGLTQVVNPKATFLHDGRAKTLEEAILWHGGEAENAKEQFRTMNASDRKALVAFLKSL